MFTVVDSLEFKLRGSVQEIGNNVVFVQKWPWSFKSDYPWWKYLNRPLPSISEFNGIKTNCKSAEAVAFRCSRNSVTLHFQSQTMKNINLMGISSDYVKLQPVRLQSGRFFSGADGLSASPVAVIGYEVSKGLFKNQNPLLQNFRMYGQSYCVIGVLKKEGENMFGSSSDYQVYIPFQQAYRFMNLKDEQSDPAILVKPKLGISTAQTMSELRGLLRSQRRIRPNGEDNFALNETRILQQGFDDLFRMVGTAGWIIGGFSILVGGFGIANMMFVSVRERTSLIGIQKSLGSPKIFILLQFLWESILLSITGGLMGIGLVVAIIIMVNSWTEVSLQFSASNTQLALSISALVGLLSGFLPAYHAAQMDPVDAIRVAA